MKTKAKHSFFRRAAIALLTMVLTATTAGAQYQVVTFDPALQSSYTFTGWEIKPSFQKVEIDGVKYIVWENENAAARSKGAYIKYGENVNVGTGTVIVDYYPSDADPLQLTCQFDIVPREVTVVVDSKEKNYGDADNLTVLIAVGSTPQTQHFVDNGADVTGKLFSHMKNSSKRSDFLRFYAYLCHVIDDFACLDLQH